MTPFAALTLAAKPEWALARVVARSFRHHHPDIPFYVVLADVPGPELPPAEEPFQIIRLEELTPPGLPALAASRTRQEFTYTLTADAIRAVLDRGHRHVGFLKQESLVTAPFPRIFERLRTCSLLLTPHLPAPLAGPDAYHRERNILQSGIYNVGFLGVSDTAQGRAFLDWWSDRCRGACRWDIPRGLHFEQRWLDLAPALFPDHDLIRDPGFNLAHWNLPEVEIRREGHRFLHPSGECSFFRFSGYRFDHPEQTSKYRPRLTLDRIGGAAEVFHQYHAALEAAGHRECAQWSWGFDRG